MPDVAEPGSTSPTDIGLVLQKGTSAAALTVGYSAPDKAFEAFKDPRYSGSESNDLPADFKYPNRARVWETALMGFGEVFYENTLVGVLYHEDKVTQDRVDSVVSDNTAQMDKIPRTDIIGKRVSYWFWQEGHQTAMICEFTSKRRGIQLTAAVGDDTVLHALGIGPSIAGSDMSKVDALTSPGVSVR